MVWAALTIILMQGVLAVVALVVIRSFGAFSSDFRAWTAAMVRTHDANKRIHDHNDYLVEELSKASLRLRRMSDALQEKQVPIPSTQEKSA